MKRVLITGANSYIGTSLERWLHQWPDKYYVSSLDMTDNSWKNVSFRGYDCIYHVAGIAHVKETKKNKNLYYEVNRDLAIETAVKAKNEGIKQFIFLSTMNVYGTNTGVINKETIPCPRSNYGKSKYEAEQSIIKMTENSFKVAILRPPMIYGKGCKGNYNTLSRFAKKTPIFPDINNKRSMLFIDNLSEFVRLLIDNEQEGLFLPQNGDYVNTSYMVRLIADLYGNKIKFTKVFNKLIKIINFQLVTKVFGDLVYERIDLCDYISFEDSIKKTEL